MLVGRGLKCGLHALLYCCRCRAFGVLVWSGWVEVALALVVVIVSLLVCTYVSDAQLHCNSLSDHRTRYSSPIDEYSTVVTDLSTRVVYTYVVVYSTTVVNNSVHEMP